MKTKIQLSGLFLLLTVSLGTIAEAKNCKKGKPCGNACISKEDVCHKESGSTANVKMPESAAPAAETKPAKNCKKGKPCGESCIPKDAVCTK